MGGSTRFLLLSIAVLWVSVSAQDIFECNYATDIDQDNDGLIELCDLDALDAVRYQLDGSGYRESFDAVKVTAGCPQSGCNGYELRKDLDFNVDGSYRDLTNKAAWTSGLGWLPIGDRLNFFSARFEGNGHTIANLYIDRPSDYVGLFRATTKLAKISDLVLSQINIKGNSYVGSLAGHNAGGIAYIGVEDGHLIGIGNTVGGLFGANTGTILNGDVILKRIESRGHSLGGLVGHNEGHIRHSVADTGLFGVSQVGGLVGLNFGGMLTDSRSDGTANGSDYVGGLVGLNRARISASYAEGKVISEGSYSGGLVGANDRGGKIADSRASGAVSGDLYAGGLVGWNRDGEITNSFALNRVDGNSDVGGLVGWNEGGSISNTYATGFVTGMHRVGGLVGSNKGVVSDSFANGQVVANGAYAGGLVGWNYAYQTRHAATVHVIHSYWNSETVGLSLSAGGSPRTTEQLKSPTAPGLPGETFERWDVADWDFGTDEQYPILRHSEGSNKGYLLSGQYIMLSGLLVLDGLMLSPAFNRQTFDYRVHLSDDNIRKIRFSPTIVNSTQTISVLKDEKISLPSVNNGETVTVNLNGVPEPTLVTIARHYRIWVLRQSGLQTMISSDRSDHRVSEGQDIRFSVSASEPDSRRVRYRWSQVSSMQPDLLTVSDTGLAELNLNIPDDFVAQDNDASSVVLQVEVRVGETTVVRNTTMTVVKTNNGSINTLAAPTYSEGILTVADISEADLSMEPDGGVDLSSLSYRWQYKLPSASALWHDIKDATQTSYEIPFILSAIDNIGYRVGLDYRDNQGHYHRIVSEPLSVMRVVANDGFSDIYYLEDLYAIRNKPKGKYELVRDLDFNSDTSYRDPINKAQWTVADYKNDADTGWLPIGTLANRFTGTFDGSGHTIFNLQINRDTGEDQGLFGALGSVATIRNIGLLNVKIEGRRHIGGLVGVNAGTIVGSYAVGEFSANSLVGGIVAVNYGKIINSYAGSVISRRSSVPSHLGGLVGTNEGVVINSHATVRISERRSNNVGGLIGWNAIDARVINSYAGGDVGGDAHVGGLIGVNRGSITNSYADGEVSGNSDVGGLVGVNQIAAARVSNSYAVGRVQGSGGGGLVATNSGVIGASYWNTETGGAQGLHGSGQTTRQMQLPTAAIGIYEEWNDADWDFGNSAQYPILKYAPGPDGDACGVPGLPQCGELIAPRLRYGLRSLATADGVALAPEFDTKAQNQSGIYIGTLSSTDNTIRLIPTTIEPTAPIRFYIGDDKAVYDRIRSGETSKVISLKATGMTRIRIEVQGTVTVGYTLYINYRNTDGDKVTPINYLEDLNAIRDRPTGSYKLARDLDFEDSESYLDPLNRIFWTVDDYKDAGDVGWVPIGSESKPFGGRFDGNGYTISGLQINRDAADNQSLFGVSTSDALISNIGLLNLKIEGGAKAAGLVGTNRGQVGYSYVGGSVQAKGMEGVAGGLIANNDGGAIIGSYALGQVSGNSSLGGLVGENNGRVINSHADSIVMPGSGGARFGGLVGHNRHLIANSYASGKILQGGSSSIKGGLVGWNDSEARIINGYAAVSVAGAIAGGLVGYNLGFIKNSYAIGELSDGSDTRGSLIGINDGGTSVASYWNSDSIASGGSNGIGQTSAQLKSQTPTVPMNSIYKDWDTADWDFGTSEHYPILKYTTAAESIFECGSSGLSQCGDLISPGLRYGLRDLTSVNDVTFSPPLAIDKLNQSGIYFGTVIAEHPSVRLIPVAMETTANIDFIGDVLRPLDSNNMSFLISLTNDETKKVIIEVQGTRTVGYTLYLRYASHRIIDEDNDGFVDIDYLEDLDAIRYQLDGSGYRANVGSVKITSGCPSIGCRGYELLRDLDFNDVGSYRNAAANMRRWTGVGAWQPIAGAFTATFKGNNKTIANLSVRASGGLFTAIGSDSRVAYIDGIGLLAADIKGGMVAGIAASCKRCTISNSYVIGDIQGVAAAAGLVNTIGATSGGHARISNSYFIGNIAVNGQSAVGGGLLGDVDSDLSITDSYVIGTITAQHDDGFIGGLVGVRTSSALDIDNSYASVSATKADMPQGLFGGNRNPSDKLAPTVHTSYLDKDISQVQVTLGKLESTVALQSPTSATGIYTSWRGDNWDFGTAKQYPAIKYNLQAHATDGNAHCDAADIQKRPDACRTLLRHQGSLLQDLKLSEGAGLSNPFAFTSFDYGISVNADRSIIRMLPTAFNPAATVEVFKEGDSIGASDSGEWTVPIPLNDTGDTVVGLVVKDGKRHSYRYRFVVDRLDIVAQSIDEDGDGLIEISDATHLNAVRHRLDGSAYQQSGTADAIYCSNGCGGYELTADIDLVGIDWQPIGSLSEPFSGVFKGNGHTISNLTIKMGNTIGVGLFEVIGAGGRVENVGLVNVNIAAQNNVGGIAGYNYGTIINSYADGKLVVANSYAGGLVGRNNGGTIVNSYAHVDVHANNIYAGGLVGWNEANSFIVNSYAIGTVRANNGLAGGLTGSNTNSAKIHDSYASGDVRVQTNGNLAGGLTASGGLIVNSYYRAGAVISRTDSLIGTDKTEVELKAGVPSDDIYSGWNRVDWHFGNEKQYPALLYATGNADDMACRQPSPEQLSDCNGELFANLSEHDKTVVCRSHLPRLPEEMPYCGALLPEQRAGLVRLEFSKNAHLIPAFNPEIYDYDLVVGSGTEFRTTPTAYYGSDTITVNTGDLSSSTSSGRSSLITLSGDLDGIVIRVQSAIPGVPTRYKIKVHGLVVSDDLIRIDYLEDLNLMRYSLERISEKLKDCPIDTEDGVRRCKGYKLTRNLDFKSPASYRAANLNSAWTTGASWQPIGNRSNPFSGLFNGNAHTISNLRIHGMPVGDIGLFGVVADDARIENIGLLSVDIDVDNGRHSLFDIGGLVGENHGKIINSYVLGGRVRGDLFVGGLVGRNPRGMIVNSHTRVDVQVGTKTNNRGAGGLVGIHGGRVLDANEKSPIIRNSYASGTVVGNNFVGGLVGYFGGEIVNSYATGDVSGNTHVGGLVGRLLLDTKRVTYNYAIGKVTGRELVGGLIGSMTNAGIRDAVDASYWDINTSNVTQSVAGIGKMTTELQTPAIGNGIYSNWDGKDWYSESSSQYPLLRYTGATDVLSRPACRETGDEDAELPICGNLLPGQGIGLSNLARSNRTGQVLLLRPDFHFGIYDYELILKSDAREFSIIPYTFNSGAVITLTDDSETNPRMELRSGEITTLSIDDIDDLLLTLAVEDLLVSKTTQTTIYRIKVSKHSFATVNDIDEDDDGLIEVRSAKDLDAIRYQLDGSGYKAGRNDTKITVGCPTTPTVGCKGYELAASIDLSGFDWHPIGVINATTLDCNDTQSRCFAAIFDGNRALGYEISGLSIVASQPDNVGLFAALADAAQVKNVNLANVEVGGRLGVGSLAAYNAGEIDNSSADGTVAGEHAVGGLVAYNVGRISNSCAYGAVSGGSSVGGLAARNENAGVITNSYSLNRVSGNIGIGGLVALNLGAIANTYASGVVEGNTRIGGLVGDNGGSVRNSYATAGIVCTGVPACTSYTVATGGLIGSDTGGIAVSSYWDTGVSNLYESAGGIGKTTLQLQSGSGQSSDASKAYYRWRSSDWHFGDVYQYPILKYTGSSENTLTGLQSYGLASLTIAEVVTLSPNFDTTKLHYRIGIDLDANIRQLHLTPNTLDEDATIRIVSDNGFDETVASGTGSSTIVLHSTATTVISVEVSGMRRVRYRFEVNYFSSGIKRDVDTDRDGLIEILTLEDLDAIRNALDGKSLRHQNIDGVSIENAAGCPTTGCKGYELLRDLDFDNPAHYRAGRVNTAWTGGAGWQPIGTSRHPFTAIFKGNGYTISNLTVNRPNSDGGLFGVIDGSETDVVIEGLALSDVDIVGDAHVGGLVGTNQAGNIRRSYVVGSVAARGDSTSAIVGGLVGRNVAGSITESYSETQVKANLSARSTTSLAGGLVALNDSRGRIENSYAVGSTIGRDTVGGLVALNRDSSEIVDSYAVNKAIVIGATSKVGGLVAVNDAVVGDSYWDVEASDVASSAGGTSATTAILRSSTPTTPINSIYRNWDTDVWEFADASRYPVLKAIANTPLFASEGKSLLQSLTLSDNVGLFPSFHPLIFDYHLIAESGQITEVRLNTTSTRAGTTIDIACSVGLVCSSGIPASFVLDGSDTPKITITTDNSDAGVLSYNFSVRYIESDIGRMTATTTTIISLPLTLAEGERVRLITSYDFGLSADLYHYRWRQSAGDALRFNDMRSPVDTQSAVLDFMVPSSVVSKQDDRLAVRLILEIVVNEAVYLSKVLPLIISKRDNDAADRIRLLKDDDKLHTYTVKFERADGSEFVDRDGGFAETRTQWQRRRSEAERWIDLVSTPTYTIPNEGNYQYRVLALYEDNQGYRGQFESEVISHLDIDDDGDGLIEIRYLEELDAIRYQPDGSGYKATANTDKITTGCPLVNGVEQCRGYELINDLDFNKNESYRALDPSLLKNSWTVSDFTDASDSGWQPIGRFDAVFDGNGYTISNMQINRSVGNTSNIGLFSNMGSDGKVRNLGLIDPAIKGLVGIKNVGGIAGAIERGSVIMNSHVVGDVSAGNTDKIITGDRGFIGGMVGWNKGFILNSYAKINLVAEDSGTQGNKRVGVGGLAGRNIDGGKVYNSYATGEVKGPCIVGGLVGNQFSTNPDSLLTRSEIKNSYATGNVETGFGTCSNSDDKIAGGLVGFNNNSRVENSYTLGEISGSGTRAGLVAGRYPVGNTSIANPVNSYWNYEQNCRFAFSFGFVLGVQCFGIAGGTKNVRIPDNLQGPIAPNTMFNSCVESFAGELESEDVCATYVGWNTADWDFGTTKQYPALKYGVGLDMTNPGCDTDPETALPSCNALLPGQIADAVLLNSLSVSANSSAVRLTPSFMPNRFNYEAIIVAETAPVLIEIATRVDEDTAITIRRDGGAPLIKQSDGTVQISTNDSFNLGIKTASGNERVANYRIQMHLSYLPQPKILEVINGSTPTELIKGNILSLSEGDVVRFDASESFGHNNSQLDYRWSQVSGKTLLSGIRTASTVEFMIAVDLFAEDEDDSTVILKLELSESNNPASALGVEIPLSVSKANNGNAGSGVKWINSNTLSAGDLSDDIDGSPLSDIAYLWSLEQNGRFVAIPGATRKSYTPLENARNAQYRVSISYTDAQGYRTNIHYDAPRFTTIANDVDKDNDGLIEIETLEALDAIRYQPDGSGYRASSTTMMITTGCPGNRCLGYELVGDLDFLDDAGYSSTANKVAWTTGAAWQPIGIVANNNCNDPSSDCFAAILEGNGYSISNLSINRARTDNVGLFAGNTGTIRNLGLSAIEVTGNFRVGGLVGRNEGELMNIYIVGGRVEGKNNVIGLLTGVSASGASIINSYVSGTVVGSRFVGGICGINYGGIIGSYTTADVSARRDTGGLVGENQGTISNSYAAGSVGIGEKKRSVGGLVGTLWAGGRVVDSYSIAEVKTTFVATANDDVQYVGGLIGNREFPHLQVNNSYWDTDASSRTNSPGGGIAKTKAELQIPTVAGTEVNAIYYSWDTDRWDFGTSEEYPVLKYYDNTCATATPSPDCGKLLLHQRIGLRAIVLEQNVEREQLYLSPDFDSAATTYTVSVHADASELRITPIAANPDAIIVADGKVLSANHSGYTIAIDTSEPTSTVIAVAARNAMGMEHPIAYKLTVSNRLPKIDINAPASISEGETLALSASIADADGDELRYSLSAISDLLPDLERMTGNAVGGADLVYVFSIPGDLLGERQSSDDIEIVLTVGDGMNIIGETMRIAIIKKNNGVISVPVPTLNGFTYTVREIDLSSDVDGINPAPEIAYRWQKELLGSWSDIDGATDRSHTVSGIIGDRYRVLVDYTDKQGYRHRGVASPAVSAPQQFTYDVQKSRSVVRTSADRAPSIFIHIRVFPEGLLR